ncbi:hypothetical protein MSG28_003018 [Choristoneura fumiferana]|uniref:Uncharacterized protein n=1 Tax=Choristoneura fumiferana TaxID=7141 RepID=A0ACC0JKD7_CHOFU|nr:hypothetical protein MSG28_003018 [Choristoneura fumiferana]
MQRASDRYCRVGLVSSPRRRRDRVCLLAAHAACTSDITTVIERRLRAQAALHKPHEYTIRTTDALDLDIVGPVWPGPDLLVQLAARALDGDELAVADQLIVPAYLRKHSVPFMLPSKDSAARNKASTNI